MRRYEKLFVVTIVFMLVLSMFAGCTMTVNNKEADANQKENKALGYAIILHYDGEEHVEFTQYFYNAASGGVITIRDIDGRLIRSNNITLIFY
jgi:hypothetical protein